MGEHWRRDALLATAKLQAAAEGAAVVRRDRAASEAALDRIRTLIERAYGSGDISQGMRDRFRDAINGTAEDEDDDLYTDTEAHLPPRDKDAWEPIEADLTFVEVAR